MGFWSKLGRGALKVGKVAVPIALAATGVGAPLAMAASAGLNAADKKASGGSWGDALKAGAIGAATSAIPGGGAASGASGAAKAGLSGALKAVATNPDTYAAIGGLASGMAESQAQNRITKTNAQLARDQVGIAANNSAEAGKQARANIELNRKADERTTINDAYQNALQSALALNTTDAKVNRPHGIPTISYSGGLRPSALGLEGKAAAEALNKRALQTLLDGPKYSDMGALKEYNVAALPEQSMLEKVMGPLGLGAGTLGALLDKQKAAQSATAAQNPVAMEPAGSVVKKSVSDIDERVRRLYDAGLGG
jgi:hypothetical protein